MKILNCMVDHLTEPLGFQLRPVFSWTVEESAGIRAAASRIRVEKEGNPLYDTGWTDLDSRAQELPLSVDSRTRYTWTVSVRTDAGEEETGPVCSFETGMGDRPWAARWIGCDETESRHPVFTRSFGVRGRVIRARLYICGLGLYEARINGRKVGREYMAPGCNNYNSWLQAQTYDVTDLAAEGGELSVIVGNGWYLGRYGFDPEQTAPYYGDRHRLIAELRLLYEDGTEELIVTDDRWKVTRSAVTFSNIYDGEHVDLTLPDTEPEPAVLLDAPRGRLVDRIGLPVTVQNELPVKEVITTPAGETVLDLGQNLTGSFRLHVREPRGTRIHLSFGEVLQKGCFYRDNLRSAKAEYLLTADGEEREISPLFTFYGYRYVKLEGLEHFRLGDYTALVLHSDVPQVGSLRTGHAKVNQLIHNAEWGQKGNFLDVPTDCPQRDERMGWTGDAQVFAPTACFQRECAAFYKKYLHDMRSEQDSLDGMVPIVVPSFGLHEASAAWGDAATIIPLVLYDYYGDRTLLEEQYSGMTAWVDWLEQTDGEDHAWRRHFHYGDWLALDGSEDDDGRLGGTDVGLIASAMELYSARNVVRAAEILGKTGDAERYGALAEKVLAGIRQTYFSPEGRITEPTQTGCLLALKHGLSVDEEIIRQTLIKRMHIARGKLETGFVGTSLLCDQLVEIGQDRSAFDLLLNEEYPGWLYEVNLGATTVWERWNSLLPDGTISGIVMNSLNHYAYGSIVGWIYRDVAGLRCDAPGFAAARLEPHVDGRLGSVQAEFRSASGLWRSGWECGPEGKVTYRCTVPFGCTAVAVLTDGEHPLGPGNHEFVWTGNE